MGGVHGEPDISVCRQVEMSGMRGTIQMMIAGRNLMLSTLVLLAGLGTADATDALPDPRCAQFRQSPLEQGTMLQTTKPDGLDGPLIRRSLPVAVGAEFIGPTRYAIGEDMNFLNFELNLFTLEPGPGACLSCKRPKSWESPLLKIAVRPERPDLPAGGIMAQVFFDLDESGNQFSFDPEATAYSFDYSGYVELPSEFEAFAKIEYLGKKRSQNEGQSFYLHRAEDYAGVLICDDIGRVPVPHCSYYADTDQLTYDATFRRTLMPQFERIRTVSEKFVSCLFEPLNEVPESVAEDGGREQ